MRPLVPKGILSVRQTEKSTDCNDTTLLFHAFQHTQFLFSQMFQYNHPYLQHIFHHLNLFFCNEHLQVLKVHLQLEQYYLHNKHIVIYYILYPLLISRS